MPDSENWIAFTSRVLRARLESLLAQLPAEADVPPSSRLPAARIERASEGHAEEDVGEEQHKAPGANRIAAEALKHAQSTKNRDADQRKQQSCDEQPAFQPRGIRPGGGESHAQVAWVCRDVHSTPPSECNR